MTGGLQFKPEFIESKTFFLYILYRLEQNWLNENLSIGSTVESV